MSTLRMTLLEPTSSRPSNQSLHPSLGDTAQTRLKLAELLWLLREVSASEKTVLLRVPLILPDIQPSFSCSRMRISVRSPESLRLLRGRHLERGPQEAVKTPVNNRPLHSSDSVLLVAVNHRIAIAWSRYADLKRLLTDSRLQKGLRVPFKCVSHIDSSVRMRVVEIVSASPTQVKRSSAKDAINTNSTDHLRRGLWTNAGYRNAGKGQALELDRPHPPPGWAPLKRKVLVNCVRPNSDYLFNDALDIDSRKAAEIATGRNNWKSLRPSRLY